MITNAFGTFVFDSSYKMINHVKYDVNDASIWTQHEKILVKKYSKSKIFYVGHKSKTMEPVKLSVDPKKRKNITEFFNAKFVDFYDRNLKVTKQKVKAAVNDDILIIQAIRNIDDINKTCNLLSKRLREWYELYLPEYSVMTEDHEKFVIDILENDKTALLKKIKIKSSESMGADLDDYDVKAFMSLAQKIRTLHMYKIELEKYIDVKMEKTMPNIKALAGSLIGAKLLAYAGDLYRLMLMPASTIQLLGAEKALFRHIKTGARCPKYGAIINHQLVAKATNKGRAARKLADKISIASRVDYYKGEFIGDKLMKQLEKQL